MSHHRFTTLSNETMSRQNMPSHTSNNLSLDQSQLVGTPDKDERGHDEFLEPAWKEMKTKAGKDRKRLPLACITCRRKKIKCSGEKPSCKHCVRSRQPCIYKGAQRKPAPRTDYMVMLDKRLKRMEERIIRIIPKEEQATAAVSSRSVVKPVLLSQTLSKEAQKKRDAQQAFGITELDGWAQRPTDNSLHKEVLSLSLFKMFEGSIFLEGKESLPSKELQKHLAEVFFDYVYGQAYFILHKPSFMRKLQANHVPPVLILAVCAIAARFSDHPSVQSEPSFLRGEQWASVARDISLKRYDKPNITIVLTYLILALHEFATCQGGRSWMFGGMAQRMAFALQLHKELDQENWGRDLDGQPQQPKLSATDQELRRRVMWSCYMMDRFTSSGTDRPLFLEEKHISLQLPIVDSLFAKEVSGPTEDIHGNLLVNNPSEELKAEAKRNTGIAGYTIRAVVVWGRIIRFQNPDEGQASKLSMWQAESAFQKVLDDAKALKKSIPPWLAYTPENLKVFAAQKIANQFIFLHIYLHQNILYLNRYALHSNAPESMPQDFLNSAMKAAIEAANAISALLVDGLEHRVFAPFAGYCAFMSSTIHIQGILSKNAKLEAMGKKNLTINIRYLSKIKHYYGMFHFFLEQLKDLYKRKVAQSRPSSAGAEKGEKSVFQYGEWFDRYPSGISPNDYGHPAPGEFREEAPAHAPLSQRSSDLTSDEMLVLQSSDSRHKQHKSKKRRIVQPPKSIPEQTSAPRETIAPKPVAVDPITRPSSGERPQTSTPSDTAFSNTEFPTSGFDSPDPNINWAELLAAQQLLYRGNGAGSYPDTFSIMADFDKQMVSSGNGNYNTWNTPSNSDMLSQDNTPTSQQVLPDMTAQDFLASQQQQQQMAMPSSHPTNMVAKPTVQQPGIDSWGAPPLPNYDAPVQLNFSAPSGNPFGKDYGFDPGFDASGLGPWFMPFNIQPPSGIPAGDADMNTGFLDAATWDYTSSGAGMDGLGLNMGSNEFMNRNLSREAG